MVYNRSCLNFTLRSFDHERIRQTERKSQRSLCLIPPLNIHYYVTFQYTLLERCSNRFCQESESPCFKETVIKILKVDFYACGIQKLVNQCQGNYWILSSICTMGVLLIVIPSIHVEASDFFLLQQKT